MESNNLQHHGVLGMKWGIRRYQNKDGSLTSDGKKRRSMSQAIKEYKASKVRKKNLKKAREARVEKQKAAEQRKKDLEAGRISVKKMTDDELKARIARLELEKSVKKLERESHDYQRGKRFVNKFLDSTIDKVADNSLADVAAQALKSVTVKMVNEIAKEEITYTNNKKK